MKVLPCVLSYDLKTKQATVVQCRDVTDDEYLRYISPLIDEVAEHYAKTGRLLVGKVVKTA